ncbi:hypothetical protein [uncultured Paraglaciecola sp.]|uniref:hypothetical protein n=1 Tax=uncultured Paraglaciecola sp. TaxID=1765024 RepID=UPI002613A577|nr:hypothetical protein [uncultured Paraglaciecola sp.]
MKDENYYIENRRAVLVECLQGFSASNAHLCFITSRLALGKMPLKTILKVSSEQGYTASNTRNILDRLIQAKLIEYAHEQQFVYVRFNKDGQLFAKAVEK